LSSGKSKLFKCYWKELYTGEMKNNMFLFIIIIIILFVLGSKYSSIPSTGTNKTVYKSTVDSSQTQYTYKTCPRCNTKNRIKIHLYNLNKYVCKCGSCGWDMSKEYIFLKFRLTGVTYQDRQSIISRTNFNDKLYLKRDKLNKYDRNAIEVLNNKSQSIGWVPKDIAASLSPKIDGDIEFFVKISQILGGTDDFHYGIEIAVSNDSKKISGMKPSTLYSPQNNSNISYQSSYLQNSSNNVYDEDFVEDEDWWSDIYEYDEDGVHYSLKDDYHRSNDDY
jgi:hypothetical protein